jgi:hypothetical protein
VRVGIAAASAVAGLVLASCLGATQIELHVATNAPCRDSSQWKGVSIAVGSPTDVETKAPTLTTTACQSGGDVGSLVIVPTGSNTDEVGILVVAGISRNPEDCAANHYQGCIVARRSIRFSPHKTLDVYVTMTNDCIGISCDATHTCVNGECVDTQSVEAPPPGTSGVGTVRCGDNGVRCPTSGQVCCLSVDVDAGTTLGECKEPSLCPPTNIVLNCDKESDCAGPRDDAGLPPVCCMSYTVGAGNGNTPNKIIGSQCLPFESCAGTGWGNEFCMDRQACVDGTKACDVGVTLPPGLMPGYFWCVLNP